jgi:hypothetical protein
LSLSVVSALETLNIDIGLQPKQWELDELIETSKCTTFGYGGRRGGGKSGGMRRIFLRRRLEYGGTDGILLRRTRQELLDNHLIPMFREWPAIREWWRADDKAIITPNGSRLLFRYAEHEQDVDKLFGVEYADVGPEEAQLFSQRELEKMKGSNRWPGTSPIKPITLMTFMPGAGKGIFYLKRIFVDRLYESTEDPSDFAFVEAMGWDNVAHCLKQLEALQLDERDFYRMPEPERKQLFLESEYGRKLASITDVALREAWLNGAWNVFEGIVFPELSDELHNLDNFAPAFDGKGCRLISAIDWADSGSTGGEQSAVDADENIFFFDEYAQRNRTVMEHAVDLTAMLNSHGRQEYTLMDLPVNNINQANLFSIQDAFRRAGLITIQAHRANIQIGLDLIKSMLKVDPNRVHPFTHELGSPRMFISRRRNPVLWKQMAELQRAMDAETGKVKYIGEDDNLDPARYIAMSRPRAADRELKRPDTLPQFTFERKAASAIRKFDRTFGKDPAGDQWFPKADF